MSLTALAFPDSRSPSWHRAVHPALPLGPISYDAATVHAFASAHAARQQRVQKSDVLGSEAFRIARNALATLLQVVVREAGSEEGDLAEAALRSLAARYGPALAIVLIHIAEDADALLGLRAAAARLLARTTPASASTAQIAASPVALIRIGILLGLADAGDTERVRSFLDDPDPDVVAEAVFLLDDAGLTP
jgi:hypothetical protein